MMSIKYTFHLSVLFSIFVLYSSGDSSENNDHAHNSALHKSIGNLHASRQQDKLEHVREEEDPRNVFSAETNPFYIMSLAVRGREEETKQMLTPLFRKMGQEEDLDEMVTELVRALSDPAPDTLYCWLCTVSVNNLSSENIIILITKTILAMIEGEQ